MKKTCSYCNQTKDISNFYRKRDSYESQCKECKKMIASMRHKLVCEYCKKEFTSSKKTQRFCSKECRGKSERQRIIIECDFCGIQIERIKSQINNLNYCSVKCKNKHQSLINTGKNNPNYKKATIKLKCDNCKQEFSRLEVIAKNNTYNYCSIKCKNEHQSIINIGKNNPNFRNATKKIECKYCKKVFLSRFEHSVFCSMDCKGKWQSENLTGKNNPNFVHGLSEEYRQKRRIQDGYSEWREGVFKRDKYTCQICKNNKGSNLQAHHLNSYDWCIEGRTDINNGITLCSVHHLEFHSIYGFGKNTKEQFEEYKQYSKTLNVV